VDERGMCR